MLNFSRNLNSIIILTYYSFRFLTYVQRLRQGQFVRSLNFMEKTAPLLPSPSHELNQVTVKVTSIVWQQGTKTALHGICSLKSVVFQANSLAEHRLQITKMAQSNLATCSINDLAFHAKHVSWLKMQCLLKRMCIFNLQYTLTWVGTKVCSK